jgi:hypothetical protein
MAEFLTTAQFFPIEEVRHNGTECGNPIHDQPEDKAKLPFSPKSNLIITIMPSEPIYTPSLRRW